MENNIFEQATREAFLFPTNKGAISVIQLWQVALTSRDGFDLDHIARAVNDELEASTEKSFVKTNPNPRAKTLAVMLEVVKHVIATKLAEKEKAKLRAENSAKREKLLSQLEKKQDAALESMSEEDIKKQLADLDNE